MARSRAWGSGAYAMGTTSLIADSRSGYRYGDPMDTTSSPYRILVTGSRYATLPQHGAFIEEKLAVARHKPAVILVHGGAPGVDHICGTVAKGFGWDVEVHEANWADGHRAGPERNKRMVKKGADVVLAFPIAGGLNKGTKQCSTFAEMMGLIVHYFELPALPA